MFPFPGMRFPFRLFLCACCLILSTGAPAADQAPKPRSVLPAGTPADIEELKTIQKALRDALPKILPSIVEIYAAGNHGSGVFVNRDGCIYSAAHVTRQPGTKLQITLSGSERIEGRTIIQDTETDAGIAFLPPPFTTSRPAVPIASAPPVVGEWVFALGHPGGYDAARGPVVRLGRVVSVKDGMLQTDCKVIGGDSGGPLFNMKGELVGIHSKVGTGLEDNVHIPIAVFTALQEQAPSEPSAVQDSTGLEFDKRLNGREVLASVAPVRQDIQNASVVFYDGHDSIAYGIPVSSDGDVTTKSSEVPEGKTYLVRAGNQSYAEAICIARDPSTDLALFHIPGMQMPQPRFREEPPPIGTIVVSNGSTTRKDRRIRLGTVGATTRSIPRKSDLVPYMGIAFEPPCSIAEVVSGTPADQAGLKPGDTVISLAGHPVSSLEDLGPAMQDKKPGDALPISVSRKGARIDATMHLAARSAFVKDEDAPDPNEDINGRVSSRRDNFPMVIQHDTPLQPSMAGGPLMDLDGNIIGLNIARANRAETFALPIRLVLATYRRMKQQAKTPSNSPSDGISSSTNPSPLPTLKQ